MSTDASNQNSKFAWREHREGLTKRSVKERVADFLEIHGLTAEEAIKEQASRCIQCPNPSCVTGCPLCNPIPEWMQLTAEGRFLEAAAVVGSVTNMAEICARLCPSERLCEHTCILDGISEPVAIASIEQFLADLALKHGKVETSSRPPNGLKVAVLGSGPGALVCADELAKLGYSVTVFDSALVPGGLIVNGTPAFRLDRSILQQRIDLLKKRGVVFRLGHNLPSEHCLDSVRSEFDAVYLGLDARRARTLDIPGADLPGVTQALPFLLDKSTPVALDLPDMELDNARVVVIGAGDGAMDCARTALRYGAREVTCCCRRDESNLRCAPRLFEEAREEGVRFVFQVTPCAIIEGPEKRARAVRLLRTAPREERDATDRVQFDPIQGTEFEVEADWIILALGFTAQPLSSLSGFEDLHASENGSLAVDNTLMTNITGVFAGGDLVRGPSFVLETVRDGRKAAANIDRYLANKLSRRDSAECKSQVG